MKRVIQALLATPHARVYNDEYIYVRCPFCGDSVKHLDEPHCSIWVKSGAPLIYHCWICDESGIVTHTFLHDMGIDNVELFSVVAAYNSRSSRKGNGAAKFFTWKDATNIQIPKIREGYVWSDRKVEYIRERMGIDYTLKSLEYMRVITSIKDFLQLNGLEPVKKYFIKNIEKNYIGFLTNDKTNIIFKDITGKCKLRYIKYPIKEGLNFGDSFYTIPMAVDPLTNDLELNIAEGVFDIHGVFFHVKKGCVENNMYAAVGGSGYKRVLRYFVRKGFMTNLRVNIFSDSDKYIRWYHEMLDDMTMWFKEVNVYYNVTKGEKDFGIRKDRIELRKAVF